ncbi:hybrid sensor histidine kinase/response regulator [Caballeronia sordidicola]|uniref:histidine kinase n=1 Tax=Caballeronia sordidicola TaxID=196367 RepID=A0A226XAF9_CABSO|nr:response regulator [Caballeronia sordidicola]OXC80485.1 Chemotaxis protein methyltransferase CheR [Caballeronia sordidicola]
MSLSFSRDEAYRLKRLQALGILDTPAELHFDAITKTAAHILRTPIALLNFIDEAREWCKSAWGMKRQHARREESLCAEALLTDDAMVIPDTARHAHFRNHPQVTGDRSVVFYAGVVLKTSDGVALGTLCAIDHSPRTVTDEELDALRTLAATVVGYIEGQQAATERATKLAAELADANRRLESAANNRDEFLAMLAHELRAPLAPIHTAAEILQRPESSEPQRAWSRDVLQRHTRYMSRIVDDLLSASLVSIGAIDLSLEPVNVAAMIQQSLEMCDADITKGKHALTVTVDTSLFAVADITQSPLIIANLLRNAATYTPPGGRIDVVVDGNVTDIKIRVLDNGVGLTANDTEDIFQLFRQTGRSLARSPGGMGLGLTLARRLAELHGGTLIARSDGPGLGSEFILSLRRSSQSTSARIPPTQELTTALTPLAVLVVDDNHDAADALGVYFELSGHEVRVTYTAVDALALAVEWTPNVVLSDVGLPDMDGYALMRALRRLPNVAPATCIAITGYATRRDREAALDAGFDAHIPKPADVGKLEQFIINLRAAKNLHIKSE